MVARSASSLSAVMAMGTATPPCCLMTACSVVRLTSYTCPGGSGRPGTTTSLPVEHTAQDGRAKTEVSGRPTAESAPSWPGPRRSPRWTMYSPARRSLPWRAMCCPAVAAAKTRTSSFSLDVRSTMTTASAPGGTSAPVPTAMHSPGVSRRSVVSPVNTRPTQESRRGLVELAST